jgi:hypothetical protein
MLTLPDRESRTVVVVCKCSVRRKGKQQPNSNSALKDGNEMEKMTQIKCKFTFGYPFEFEKLSLVRSVNISAGSGSDGSVCCGDRDSSQSRLLVLLFAINWLNREKRKKN